MAWFSSLRLSLPLRGSAGKSSARSSIGAVREFFPPQAVQKVKAGPQAQRAPRPASLPPRDIEKWHLWKADGLRVAEGLTTEETIFEAHLVCMRMGCGIDWIDSSREANLTLDVAEVLEEAHSRARNESLKNFCPPRSVTDQQCTLFRVMKSSGLDYGGILLISWAANFPASKVKMIRDKVLNQRGSCRLSKSEAVVRYGGLPDSTSSARDAGGELRDSVEQNAYHPDTGSGMQRLPQPLSMAALQDVKRSQAAATEVMKGGINSQKHSPLRMKDQQIPERQLSDCVEALDLMVQQGSYVDVSLIYSVLKKCIAWKDLVVGKRLHAVAIKSGYGSNSFLANHIICMYASHGELEEAMQVFTKVAKPDCYMWASIILAHVRNDQPGEAIRLYGKMRESTVKPDNHVFVAVLRACASACDLASGKEVHAHIVGSTLEPDMFVYSGLVGMYVKCGSLLDARCVFDRLHKRDVVTWNCMIGGYVQHGFGQDALDLYADMQQDSMNPASNVTFVWLLQACAHLGDINQGKKLHAQIQQRGLEADVVVSSSLVDMYAKCGSLDDARKVFNRLPSRDVVTWTAMIAGYAKHGLGQEALALYAVMQQDGMSPANNVTFVCLLQACASVGALYQGKKLHAQILQKDLEGDVVVGTCLVDMYAKCGRVEDAHRLFHKLATKDVVVWNALLNGYAEHSDGQMAIQLFEEMREQGVVPDGATFVSLLVACSHEGLVHEGERYFRAMVEDYGIEPIVSHYNCMVDLLGRSGCLDRAEDMLQSMPFEDDVVGWTSLLSACKSHGDIERGRRCFDRILGLEPENASAYVLLATIYANAGRWADAHDIESMRKSAGAKKKAAKACIEVQNKVHEFTVGEENGDISSKLRSVNLRLKGEGGYVPQTELVLKAVSEREKEDELCGHAEKLALAYGLLNTPDGTTLLVTKNLRMCNDCHSSTKIMSLLEKREIVVRDAHRVHRFVGGYCSCGDRH